MSEAVVLAILTYGSCWGLRLYPARERLRIDVWLLVGGVDEEVAMAEGIHKEVPSGEPRHTAMVALTLTPLKNCFCGGDLHQVRLETAQLPGPIDQDGLIQQHLVDDEIVARFSERGNGAVHPLEDRFTDAPYRIVTTPGSDVRSYRNPTALSGPPSPPPQRSGTIRKTSSIPRSR